MSDTLVERLRRYFRQCSPHVAERQAAQLINEAAVCIEQLQRENAEARTTTKTEGYIAHRCKKNLYGSEHEWTQRTDSMGDPDGRYGESTWQVDVCRWCDIERQELSDPLST